ncbi:MAG: hypothetical protein AAF630_10665 [Cyanobacteria bacterium P01_C01_bin.38]
MLQNRNKIEELRQEYLRLTNEVLPNIAKQRKFPVRFNHCFQRIILDNIFGCCWYDALDKSKGAAYQQLNATQLEKAISLASFFYYFPTRRIHRATKS